jgi:hypothetical protein
LIGLFGIILTGLTAAIAVRALQTATDDPTSSHPALSQAGAVRGDDA